MMKINKRYKRGILRNVSFYICMIFLTAAVVLMFLMFTAAVNGERNYINDFTKRNVLESGQFEAFTEISNDDIKELEKKYDLTLEKQEYSDLKKDSEDKKVRIFRESEKINKTEITHGSKPQKNDEICLSERFAELNGLAIGDTVFLDKTSYTITGFCERPDYLFMIENRTDASQRADAFGLGMVFGDAFEDLSNKKTYYSVVYNDTENSKAFREEINEKYITLSYTSDYANHRITTPADTVKQYEDMVYMILPVLLLFVVAIIAVILGRKVHSEQKHIGTLMALGYKKSEIVRHYTLYSIIPGVIGELFGLVLNYILVGKLAGEFFFKLEKLPVAYHSEPLYIIIAMTVPVATYVVSSVLTVLKTMNVSITGMLSGNDDRKKQGGALVESDMSFKRKYRFRAIFNKPLRTLIIIAGLLISGLIMSVALMLNDSCDNYSTKVIDEVGSFEYEYYLKNFESEDYDEAVSMIADTLEIEGSKHTISLFGTSQDNPYLNLNTIEGEKADLSEGYYISSIASVIFGVKEGDVLKAYNTRNLEEYDIEIKGIIDNKAQSVIYTSEERARNLQGVDAGSFNMLMSGKELNIDDDKVSAVIPKEDMKEMIQNVISGMRMMIYIMFIFGMIICIITIYLMVNMIIEESTVIISMLKVLGYKNSEINKITVNIYHALVPIGIGLSLLGGWFITKSYYEANTSVFQAYVPVHISLFSIVLFIGAIVFSYIISLAMLGNKVKRVNMSESLKDVRA